MAKIWMEPAKARAVLNQQEALAKTLTSLYQDVGNVRSGLRYKISGREAISARLQEAAGQISREAESTRALRAALEQAVGLYEKTEKANVDRVKAEKTSIQQSGNSGGSQTSPAGEAEVPNPFEWKWVDLLLKELTSLVGPFGFLITGTQKLLQGKPLEAINEVVKTLVGKGAKIVTKPTSEWAKNIIGWTPYTKKSFLEELFGTYSEGKTASNIANGIGAAVKWGTTFIDRAIKNAGEHAINTGRFWGETILETGIKMVEGGLINLGVGAAATALFANPISLGVTAAAVGVTFVVDWGLNGLVSWATGGEKTDWVDAAADFLIDDVGPAIKKGVDKGVEVVKDLGGKAVNAVKDGYNAVKDGVSNFFSGCKWGRKLFA